MIDSNEPFAIGSALTGLVNVTFDINPESRGGRTRVEFDSSIATLSTASRAGDSLATRFSGGIVTINGPASNGVEISGRVFDPNGRGLRNATITLIDQSGARRAATTSSFGSYTFTGVAAGQDYTLAVDSRRYRFASRRITAGGSLAEVDFTALE